MADFSAVHDKVPEVMQRRRHKVSKFFTVDELDLRFSNGESRTYERLSGGNGAVIAVPFDGHDFYMSSEYACGFERYELGFVKGKIDAGETPEQACLRELSEEIGFGCRKMEKLKKELSVAPGMLSLKMHCFLCTDLYPHVLKSGDEPEPIRLIKVSASEALDLAFDPNSPLTEARSIACLLLSLRHLHML